MVGRLIGGSAAARARGLDLIGESGGFCAGVVDRACQW